MISVPGTGPGAALAFLPKGSTVREEQQDDSGLFEAPVNLPDGRDVKLLYDYGTGSVNFLGWRDLDGHVTRRLYELLQQFGTVTVRPPRRRMKMKKSADPQETTASPEGALPLFGLP